MNYANIIILSIIKIVILHKEHNAGIHVIDPFSLYNYNFSKDFIVNYSVTKKMVYIFYCAM